jgi:hypothetical protein
MEKNENSIKNCKKPEEELLRIWKQLERNSDIFKDDIYSYINKE